MNSVVFIKYSPLTKKVYDDYCFESLLNNGYCVEYWDVTSLFKIKLPNFEEYSSGAEIVIRRFDSYKQLEKIAYLNNDALFISLMTCRLNQFRLLRVFSRINAKFAFWGPSPIYTINNNVKDRIKRITLHKCLFFVKNEIMHLLIRMHLVKYYDYYFSVGKYGYMSLGIYDKVLLGRSKALPVNSFDFEDFYFNCGVDFVTPPKYIVFIDQYFPFHPDYIISGNNKSMPADLYYQLLNNAFSLIEERFNIRIVIAAHPKAVLYKNNNYFNGREVYFGKTNELIKKCEFVLAHSSTAIYYAIMSAKPVVLMSTKLFDGVYSDHSTIIKSLSSLFRFKVIKLEEFDIHDISESDIYQNKDLGSRYDLFIREYCTDLNDLKSNKELINSYLETIFG